MSRALPGGRLQTPGTGPEPVPPGLALDLSQDLEFAGWLLRCDPDTTREIYARMDDGACERCGCEPCWNFAAARHLIYPTGLVDLFEWLGIDPLLESEVAYLGPIERGWHAYSGWFHLVGQVLRGPRENLGEGGSIQNRSLVSVEHDFSVAFSTDRRLAPEGFAGWPLVELEFEVAVPWVSNEDEPV